MVVLDVYVLVHEVAVVVEGAGVRHVEAEIFVRRGVWSMKRKERT